MIDQRKPRVKDERWLEFVRTQPCCVCNSNVGVQAHHPRVGTINSGSAKVTGPGMGEKASDRWAVALCDAHHRLVHSEGERWFWLSRGLDPFAVALNYAKTPPLNYRMP
jgi:hypothetical protein